MNDTCGKSEAMKTIGGMCPRHRYVELMKAAPFFRLCEEYAPVFLIDEMERGTDAMKKGFVVG